jgi:hypothetical protein
MRVVASTPSVQGRGVNPKVRTSKPQSRRELAGRRAGVGYSSVVIAVTLGLRPVSGAAAATMRLAKPCQVVMPAAVK